MLQSRKPLSRKAPLRSRPVETRVPVKPRPRRCKVCKAKHESTDLRVEWCSEDCAVTLALKRLEQHKAKVARKKAKLERDALKERKEKIKTRKDFIAPAQTSVNTYVRLRDADLPCVSCDKPAGASEVLTGGGWDCGHFLSRGAHPNLRFDLRNMAKQCKRCNRDQSGNAGKFRAGLIVRIGVEKVEALEADQAPRKHDIEWLKRFTAIFRKKTRRLEKRRGK